jgi:hypothetical protein
MMGHADNNCCLSAMSVAEYVLKSCRLLLSKFNCLSNGGKQFFIGFQWVPLSSANNNCIEPNQHTALAGTSQPLTSSIGNKVFVKLALQLKPEYQQKTTSFKRKNEIVNTIQNSYIFSVWRRAKHFEITPKRGK